MNTDGKLMEMLTGYAASHQHPFNVLVHMIGIPTIMFGVLIPLSWLRFDFPAFSIDAAQITLLAFVFYYFTLDALFAVVFAVLGGVLTYFAARVGTAPIAMSGGVAAACFFGGYALQFIGHAVEKSMPVLVKHPIQAQIAAPFFTVVELCKILKLREDLFDEVQRRIAIRREKEAAL